MNNEWKVTRYGNGDNEIHLVSLKNSETGITVHTPLARNGSRSEAVIAWAAGRYSRSPDSVEQILEEIYRAGVDVVAKLDKYSRGYGHASLADMAIPMIYVEGVPLFIEPSHFYLSRVDAGQGRSTRYQDFSRSLLTDFWLFMPDTTDKNDPKVLKLKEKYGETGKLAVGLYAKWVERLTKEFTNHFQPVSDKEKEALVARAFDTARGFLLAGLETGFADRCSAREWARLVSMGKGGRLRIDREVAKQIEELLAPQTEIEGYIPEVDRLLRHTGVNELTSSNLVTVERFIRDNFDPHLLGESGDQWGLGVEQSVKVMGEDIRVEEKMAMQYFLSCFPLLGYEKALEMVAGLSDEKKQELSYIMFSGHSHRVVMGNQAEVTGLTAVLKMTMSELRDFVRHRAQGKFSPWIEIRGDYRRLLKEGYILPLYLGIPGFEQIKGEFERDMKQLFSVIGEVGEMFDAAFGSTVDDGLFLSLFPMAGAVYLFMHSDPKQEVYFPSLRTRNGGMINYRVLAYERARQMSQLSPLLTGLMLQSSPPDPTSREEFFDRG